MKDFKVGDEVYIKGVVGNIFPFHHEYPIRINIGTGVGVLTCTRDGRFTTDGKCRSFFHLDEIQSPKREYKIGQKLNGFAEVMRAILDGQFVDLGNNVFKVRNGITCYFSGNNVWQPSLRNLQEIYSGTIVEDPTPKKMVAYRNNITGAFYITEKEISDGNYEKSTKQELAAVLERVE